jgi:DNA (cytosine-5)-methyltransferase 1
LQHRDSKGVDSDTKPGHILPVVPYDLFQITAPINRQNRDERSPCHTLARDNAAHAAVVQPMEWQGGSQQDQVLSANAVCPSLAHSSNTNGGNHQPKVWSGMSVRRLTPVECERLQGFSDGHTAIPWKGKPASECPDGPRYRALGNSMAVNVMRWIGRRIELVEKT